MRTPTPCLHPSGHQKKNNIQIAVERAIRQLHREGMLTVVEAAAKSGISIDKLRWRLQRKLIPSKRFGPCCGVKLRDVLKARTFEEIRERGLLSLREAAQQSGISEARLYWLAQRRRVRCRKFGSYYGFELKDVLAARPVRPPDGYYSVFEAARRLGIPRESLRKPVHEGLIPSIEYQGREVVKLEDVRAYRSKPAEYVKVSEAAHVLGVSVAMLHEHVSQGHVPYIVHHGVQMVHLAETLVRFQKPAGYVYIKEASVVTGISVPALRYAADQGRIACTTYMGRTWLKWRHVKYWAARSS